MNLSESSTTTSNSSDQLTGYYWLFFALFSAATVCGNILVVLAFCVNKKLRKFSNFLLLNLAISDIVIGEWLMYWNAIMDSQGSLFSNVCLIIYVILSTFVPMNHV